MKLNYTRTIMTGMRYVTHKVFSRFYRLGWKVAIMKNVSIQGAHAISLGDQVFLDNDCVLNAFDTYQNYTHKFQVPHITIGNNVGIGKGTYISAINSIRIDKNAMIGPYCFICDYDHGYGDVDVAIVLQKLSRVHGVHIGEGTWLCAHVTVTSGVNIGKHVVIGANSVVTHDIPDYSVAVGVPAKVINRYNPKTKNWEKVKE